jgi:leader peptidase (prepilin peptidase)/N-methyltransferase
LPDEPLAATDRAGILLGAAERIKSATSRMSHFLWSYRAWGAVALCAVAASVLAAPGLSGVLGGGLAVVMIAIAAIDARRFVIPDKLVLAGLLLGFVEASISQSELVTTALLGSALLGSALRSIALALAFWGFRTAYRRIRGREGIGLGDVKLAAVAGAWLGWTAAALAIDIAALSALAVVLIRALRGQRVTSTTAVPFGLFFAPAIWLAWLFAAMSLRLTF